MRHDILQESNEVLPNVQRGHDHYSTMGLNYGILCGAFLMSINVTSISDDTMLLYVIFYQAYSCSCIMLTINNIP